MDFRKLIEFGNGSYIVTIPRSWAKQNNLKKGDLISVDEKEHELVIGAKSSAMPVHTDIVIETSGKDIERIRAEVVRAYLNCHDTIIIHTKGQDKHAQSIKDMLRSLSGMEIMEHDASKIIAKNILNAQEVSMETIIRRMDIIVRSMIDDALLCASGHYSPAVLDERDRDVNRLYFMGSRTVKNAMQNPALGRLMKKTPWQLHSDRMLLMRLEKIADCQKRIGRLFLEMKFDKETLGALQKLSTQFKEDFERTMKAYYTVDGEDALNIQFIIKDRTDACDAFLQGLNSKLMSVKQSTKQRGEGHTAAAKLTENLKASFVQLKNMARYVLCY